MNEKSLADLADLADIIFSELTYLKLSGIKLGLLINFNTPDLAKSIIRIVNKL